MDGTLVTLAARYADARPAAKCDRRRSAGRSGRRTSAGTIDTALVEALRTAPLKQAVASVTAALSLPRKQVYARALALKGDDPDGA